MSHKIYDRLSSQALGVRSPDWWFVPSRLGVATLSSGEGHVRKLFDASKTIQRSRNAMEQFSESLSAKLYIEFIVLRVWNRFYNLLKKNMLRLEEMPNYITVLSVLCKHKKIKIVRRDNGRYAVTKRPKTILIAFVMDEEDVRKTAAVNGALLAESGSLLEKTECDDNEENYDDGTDEINACD